MKLSPKLKIGIIIILFVALFVVLNLTSFSKEVKNFFYLMSSPIQKALWRAGDWISDFFALITEIKNLKRENEELQLRIQELLAENIYLRELKKENEILRKALGIGLKEEFKLEISEVIGKDISSDTILINKGLKNGLEKNLPVITQQKILVGKISQVYRNFSEVQLISNKEISFDVKVRGKDISGLIKGKGNLRLLLDLIPREKEIKEGDLIVTSALGGIFPQGLLVGGVEKVIKSDIEMWQKAEVKPAFHIGELENLFIIKEF